MYINRAPGIMQTRHSPTEAEGLVAEAHALSDGSAVVEAAIAVAKAWGGRWAIGEARRLVEVAERAGDPIGHSVALDLLTGVTMAHGDFADAVRTARRRLELLDTLAVDALSGFEFGDGHLMAAEADLCAGDLAGATVRAAALARLPFYRDEDHIATCRRLFIDALAGHFDDVVQNGERFRSAWERAGRPAANNLGRGAYAVAMVHGIRGDDDRRAMWVRVTIELGIDPDELSGHRLAWRAVFDGLLALHRNDAGEAVRLLAMDIDTPELFERVGAGPWRPWYAALWAEAAVLDHLDDAADRVERGRRAARNNPVATAMVERAAAIAAGDRDTLARLTVAFARLGCPYQQARTARLASAPLPRNTGVDRAPRR